MKTHGLLAAALAAVLLQVQSARAAEMTELSCDDFRPTPEALERFENLRGACEGVVEINGELYGLFKAVVRRVGNRTVTLYLPAVDRTWEVTPQPDARVNIGGRKVRPRELSRGQEISIYLSVAEFSQPDIDEIAFVTEENLLVEHHVEPVSGLPTTASPWPTVAMLGLLLLLGGMTLRRLRKRHV